MTQEAYTLPVFKTQDYTIFKKLNGNRELYQNHVARLVKLLEEEPEFTKNNPIHVNEKMEVIDGQHRLHAFERFAEKSKGKAYLYYVKINGIKLSDARKLNAGSKAWIPQDYAVSYSSEGNKNYETYLKFSKEFKVNHGVLTKYLAGLDSRLSVFRQGLFVVKDEKKAKHGLSALRDVGAFYKYWKLQHFGVAFHQIVNSPQYDHERMLEQMKQYGDGMNGVPQRVRETAPAINMIYNWKRKDKVDLLDK